ncbi:unnamed protein product [Larinioides sclopetarius]|uniref:Uncharacterized protein n=1 Tax=Larinioides sclopetarius TaxID=280406 RepID=A0AAV1Z738_9ARAC
MEENVDCDIKEVKTERGSNFENFPTVIIEKKFVMDQKLESSIWRSNTFTKLKLKVYSRNSCV